MFNTTPCQNIMRLLKPLHTNAPQNRVDKIPEDNSPINALETEQNPFLQPDQVEKKMKASIYKACLHKRCDPSDLHQNTATSWSP